MEITDDSTREAAIKLVRSRESEQYGGSYDDLNKTLKGYAKQLTGGDLSSEGISPMGQVLYLNFRLTIKDTMILNSVVLVKMVS